METFLTKEFVFDPEGFMDLPTLEHADSRANPFEERGNDVNDHGPYSTPFGVYVEKSKSNGQRSKSTSQRLRSTHGQPQPKPNICACDPSKLWAEIHIYKGVINLAIMCIYPIHLGLG